MCGNPTWALWSPLWAWDWWQSSSVCFSWGRKKFIQWQRRVPKSDPALSIVYRKRPRRELASCKPHSLVHSGYHGLWKCEGCRTSWHFKINILFSFTNLLHLVMHRQAEKPTVHEKWAWEFYEILSAMFCPNLAANLGMVKAIELKEPNENQHKSN